MSLWQRFTNNLRIKSYIYELTDVSHNAARRYSVNILLPDSFLAADIVGVIEEINEYLKGLDKHPVQVISSFVYLSEDDIVDAMWTCRSQWIDDSLQFKPNKLEGLNIGNGIVVDWR